VRLDGMGILRALCELNFGFRPALEIIHVLVRHFEVATPFVDFMSSTKRPFFQFRKITLT
jgi:hypothetical protein